MARILAIDYGSKRTGLAVTDPQQRIASGLITIATRDLLQYLDEYMKKEAVELLVIGEPRQMDNTPSRSRPAIDDLIRKLNLQHPSTPVVLADERFTSRMAFQSMIDSGLKKKSRQDKSLVDMISATIILQGFMESKQRKKEQD